MKIDTTLIENYDELSAEEKITALENFEYDDRQEEIERYKNAVSKANSEAAQQKRKLKEILSEEEQAKMSRDEEFANMQNRLKELETEKSIATFKGKYLANGYTEELAISSATAMVNGDTETLFKNQKTFIEQLSKNIKIESLSKTPTPPAGEEADLDDDYIKKANKCFAEGKFAEGAYNIRMSQQKK